MTICRARPRDRDPPRGILVLLRHGSGQPLACGPALVRLSTQKALTTGAGCGFGLACPSHPGWARPGTQHATPNAHTAAAAATASQPAAPLPPFAPPSRQTTGPC